MLPKVPQANQKSCAFQPHGELRTRSTQPTKSIQSHSCIPFVQIEALSVSVESVSSRVTLEGDKQVPKEIPRGGVFFLF